MKGIILAGGSGTRLYPMTQIVSKQLQPIYDKPMIYYPLSTLMLAGIKDILIISTERDTPFFRELLGDGQDFGINLQYKIQPSPKGLAEAFIIGKEFIGQDDVTLILGDNLFYGDINFLKQAVEDQKIKKDNIHCRIFGYYVEDPRRYGVVEFDKTTMKAITIEEKPELPKSHYAVPGIYVFDHRSAVRAEKQAPSKRGEIEITDLIDTYLKSGELGVQLIGQSVNWLDTGTPESLLEAAQLVMTIQKRQGLKIACLEEIGYRMGYLTKERFLCSIDKKPKSPYKQYLQIIMEEES